MADGRWKNLVNIDSREYRCGFCGREVASDKGYYAANFIDADSSLIYICPNCAKPTYFNGQTPTPGVSPGNEVESVPSELHALYDEARRAVSVAAHTASVLVSRKMLMNIAVQHGAKEGQSFFDYVQYLASKGFVPPNGHAWVDHIRQKGNEATHEISLMTQDDAMDLIAFVEMLLKFIYEFPARVPKAPAQ